MRKILLSLAMIPMAISSASADFVGMGAGFSIPDNDPGGASSDIIVALGTNETITDVTVTLNGATHTWVGDLIVTLSGPGGSMDLLVRPNDVLESSDLDGDYTFADTGADFWAAADAVDFLTPVPPGTYYASDDLNNQIFFSATYGGTLTNGTWTLTISDSSASDTGAITGWTLDITSSAIPEPASLGLAGLAGLGLAFYRRRR